MPGNPLCGRRRDGREPVERQHTLVRRERLGDIVGERDEAVERQAPVVTGKDASHIGGQRGEGIELEIIEGQPHEFAGLLLR